jgi:hypothetical protein
MVSMGEAGTGCMEPRDWEGFQQWLDVQACCGNVNRQGFIVDGTSAAEIIQQSYPSLLRNTLGATYACGAYHDAGCLPGETVNDQQNCVRVEPSAGSPFGAGVASDVSGNWCPFDIRYSVLGTTGTGFGNKTFEMVNSGYQTPFAQVINDQTGAGSSNFRSVLDSFSYHLFTARDSGNLGLNECAYATGTEDSTARMMAATAEIENAIKWTLSLTEPQTQIGFGVDPCGIGCDSGVDEEPAAAPVMRLYQNRPNPFNPRTVIKFSLAADGPAKLIIYDVNGRRIRTLIDRSMKAGTHELVWDGTADAGHMVTSGVYWSQMVAGDYVSNKQLVVLK